MSTSVNRKRKFSLPGIQDLNKDQDAAIAMPLEGQHVIIGGPGTGKSVVALLRARRLAEESNQYRVVVYNHLLESSNQHLFGTDQVLLSKTWEKWFRDLYKHIFKSYIPTLESTGAGNYQPIDWEAVEKATESENVESILARVYYLVIDEGQDMPPAFYRALANLGLENFYVVADQNQQIFPETCSSRQAIEDSLGVETQESLELKTNYRNTRSIALLAQHFYPGDSASPPPDLPETKQAQSPQLWVYGTQQTPSLSEIVARILTLSDRDPRKLIGIITPNHKVRETYLDEINRCHSDFDNGPPPVSTYKSGRDGKLNFSQGGIMVLTAQSCKGLEFDIVILADIDSHMPKQDVHTLKCRFYVMTTRAREQVILLRTGPKCAVVENLLPNDHDILSRR